MKQKLTRILYFLKYKLWKKLKVSLGTAFIVSGVLILAAATIKNDLVPSSFPVFFDRPQPQVLNAKDTSNIPIFNPELVVSDTTFRSSRDFPNTQSIQSYLSRIRSPLANFRDGGKSAAQIIFEASRGISSGRMTFSGREFRANINPAMILVKLETEQSLLSLTNYNTTTDPEGRIAKAMGYACFDFQSCDPSLRGFTNQVNKGAWQLEYNFQLATSPDFPSEPYRVGKTITTLDERRVNLSNASTASFYRYTPHVYWGNYNVWKVTVANGWGVNTSTFSRAAIDQVNLPIKRSIEVRPIDYGIKLSDVQDSLRKQFRIGTTSEEIRQMQRFLRQEGYYTREPSGFFGAITKYAQESYMEDKGTRAEVNTPPSTPLSQSAQNLDCFQHLKKNFRYGETNEDNRRMQACLRRLGFFNHPTDTGMFGPVTRSALDAYRRSIQAKVFEKQDPTPTQNSAPTTQPITGTKTRCINLYEAFWRLNDVGSNVRELQKCLADDGFLRVAASGRFGSATQTALRQARQANGINQSTGVNSIQSPRGVVNVDSRSFFGFRCGDLKNANFRFGESGNRVRALQSCLNAAGIYNFNRITGNYWYETDRALIAWRK
jgi:peptidoglycan hydrolase-like protein with peptidoglycan-binding domain